MFSGVRVVYAARLDAICDVGNNQGSLGSMLSGLLPR